MEDKDPIIICLCTEWLDISDYTIDSILGDMWVKLKMKIVDTFCLILIWLLKFNYGALEKRDKRKSQGVEKYSQPHFTTLSF